MISIQSSLTELDRAHQLREGVLDCYLSAIKNSAHYALELDEEITGSHRKYLRALAAEIATADDQTLLESRSTLRSILRDYRDKGSQHLSNLREELGNTARALGDILDSLSHSD